MVCIFFFYNEVKRYTMNCGKLIIVVLLQLLLPYIPKLNFVKNNVIKFTCNRKRIPHHFYNVDKYTYLFTYLLTYILTYSMEQSPS